MKNTDIILIVSYARFPEWSSDYLIEQYARLANIKDWIKCLNLLSKEGKLNQEKRGQMSFYLPTESGIQYLKSNINNFDFEKIIGSDGIKDILKKIIANLEM